MIKLTEGGYNKVFRLRMDDGKKCWRVFQIQMLDLRFIQRPPKLPQWSL